MSKRVFILSEEMRSTKSGFYVEGTDIEMDYPDAYPLPMETEVLENGAPVSLRVLPNCPYLEKEKQLQNGYPATYRYTDGDRKKLTFRHARLELDEQRDRMWLEYITRSAWMKGNELKKPRQTTRTIFQAYDEDLLLTAELDVEELIIAAKSKVISLNEVELKDLYRLAVGGNYSEIGMTIKQIRKYLLNIADSNPDFITNGIKTTRDHLTVLLHKAIELKVLRVDTPGQVMFLNPVSKEWVNMLSLSEAQGFDAKFDKFIEFLMTDMGKAELSIIENRVKELEQPEQEASVPQEMFEDEETKTKTKRR